MIIMSSLIPTAQELPVVLIAIRSASTLCATEPASSISSSGAQAAKGQHRSQSPWLGGTAMQHPSSKSMDLMMQRKNEPGEDIGSVPPASASIPSDTHELFLILGKEDAGAFDVPILLRACDVSVQNCEPIADFEASQLGARSYSAPLKRDWQRRGSKVPLPITRAQMVSTESIFLPSGISSTNSVSTWNAPRVALEEATSAELQSSFDI